MLAALGREEDQARLRSLHRLAELERQSDASSER